MRSPLPQEVEWQGWQQAEKKKLESKSYISPPCQIIIWPSTLPLRPVIPVLVQFQMITYVILQALQLSDLPHKDTTDYQLILLKLGIPHATTQKCTDCQTKEVA